MPIPTVPVPMNRIDYDGSGELWISSIGGAREDDTSRFDRVITVCQDSVEDNISDEQTYTHYNMSDGDYAEEMYGGSCEYELFEEAASELHEALSDDEAVLIHCHMGASRSTSVSIAALGRLLDLHRAEAYDIVERYRPQTHPERLLLEHAARYINENGERNS